MSWTKKRRQGDSHPAINANFKHISHLVLVCLLLTCKYRLCYFCSENVLEWYNGISAEILKLDRIFVIKIFLKRMSVNLVKSFYQNLSF